MEELLDARTRLAAAGVEVLGPTDHHFVHSIYFFDPNGFRLELTVRLEPPGYMAQKKASAHAEIAAWSAEKQALRAAAHA